MTDMHMARDFPEVFSDDLLGLPLKRRVEFIIDLLLGMMPIIKSSSSYHLGPTEMIELMTQLLELLDKGFIRPSS